MRAIILCGGKGTRLGEETNGLIPKPMVDVCGKPLHERVIECFLPYGVSKFVLATGKMRDQFRRYWRDYDLYHDEVVTFSYKPHVSYLDSSIKIDCLYTGDELETGARLFRSLKYLEDCCDIGFQADLGDHIFLTYGDGVSDVNLEKLLKQHIETNKTITVTAIRNQSKFGTMKVSDSNVLSFKEKPDDSSLINGGFMVINRKLLANTWDFRSQSQDILGNNCCSLEHDILPFLTYRNQVGAYIHEGYWQCVDTPRDLKILRERYK